VTLHSMASARVSGWNPTWRGLLSRYRQNSGPDGCIHSGPFWRKWRRGSNSISLAGSLYCLDECLERAILKQLRRLPVATSHPTNHRIPLGLVLLSKKQITPEQLRTALDAQRSAGRGRIGEWLQELGFVNERQVTAALARQWSCPILSETSHFSGSQNDLQIPVTLMEHFAMMQVEYIAANATIHVAFGEGIDYTALYAIEQMTGCRTEPCMALSSFIRGEIQALAHRRDGNEIVFNHVIDEAELSRIVCSYCARLGSSEIRLDACGPYIWVRLSRPSRHAIDLLIRSPYAAH
jgi:hypothetical protein